MIRDLFHSPPIYKANITLSFKPREKTNMQAKVGDKRKPITFSGKGESSGAGGKKGRGERQLYMDTVGQKGRGGRGGGPRPGVSNYRPGKSSRPSGQYNVPQGKYSSKINNKGAQEW